MITEYPIEDLIIISGAREQKKRKPAYSKGNVCLLYTSFAEDRKQPAIVMADAAWEQVLDVSV